MSGETTYDEIVRILCEEPDVHATVKGGMKRFGTSGELRVGGKMFAFCAKGRLIVKLPQSKVAALIEEEVGQPCVMGRRTMREWVTIGPERESEWLSITMASKSFVQGLAHK